MLFSDTFIDKIINNRHRIWRLQFDISHIKYALNLWRPQRNIIVGDELKRGIWQKNTCPHFRDPRGLFSHKLCPKVRDVAMYWSDTHTHKHKLMLFPLKWIFSWKKMCRQIQSFTNMNRNLILGNKLKLLPNKTILFVCILKEICKIQQKINIIIKYLYYIPIACYVCTLFYDSVYTSATFWMLPRNVSNSVWTFYNEVSSITVINNRVDAIWMKLNVVHHWK